MCLKLEMLSDEKYYNNKKFYKITYGLHLPESNMSSQIIPVYFKKYYCPRNNYDDDKLKSAQLELLEFRNFIYEFKEGSNIQEGVDIISSMVCQILDNNEKENIVFIPIPASSKEKTEQRLKEFSESVAKKMGCVDGYGIFYNKKYRKPIRYGGIDLTESNFNEYIGINESKCDVLKEKDIILFDDIITKGNSLKLYSAKLKKMGANNIIGVFFGRTYNPRFQIILNNIGEMYDKRGII